MEPLFLFEATSWTQADLNEVVRQQLEEGTYNQADSLRTAVMYCPREMTPGEWVKACVANGVREHTARSRYSEVRRMQREFGEI
jgi:uncharacterized protein YecA (UPF0149 family)